MTTKKQTSVRFSAEDQRLLGLLVSDEGLSQTGVMDMAVRDLARRRGIAISYRGLGEGRHGRPF